jgi:AcrR family transcriptional regulator
VVAIPTRDRRAERREAVAAEILAAAWDVARSEGLAGLNLRDVAQRIGMRPPSLYWYFASKSAIYDAMFVQGNRQLLERLDEQDWPTDARAALCLGARVFVEFCVEDVQRYQLLFQRTIPNFEPSADAYGVAVQLLDDMRARLASVGVTDASAFDTWTALVSGLAAQQIANDPDGDRWLRLVDDVVDMYVDHTLPVQATTTTSRTATSKRKGR